ncbi:hypothetical protein GCM10023185_15700 [Hymenobacter saemangeumensis]|uniref:Uncharacterized protein n=1 Tax=Hymenobacter saemangeumensis TaxID=1084522 RepID=A0ABP8I9U9_9BACT
MVRPLDGTVLRGPATGRKSRNNLFGARLVRETGSGELLLENLAEGSFQAALYLRLPPVRQ